MEPQAIGEYVRGRGGHISRRNNAQGATLRLAGFLATILVGSLLAAVGPALAASPLSWASPIRADDQPPFASPAAITGVSCPSTGLCVAVDSVGDVLISTDPTGGTGAWTKTYAGENSTGVESFTGVSCPSAKLCVAVDSDGDVVTSTDPAGGAGAWTKAKVDISKSFESEGENITLEGVSCPSASLCVATDAIGDVLTSTDPAGGASAWTRTKVTTPNEFGGGNTLGGVSCPSVRLCVATAGEGNMVSSTDPTGGMGAWSETDVDGTNNLPDVSCVSESLCVASNDSGSVLTSTDPTGGEGAWKATHVSSVGSIEHISCASWGLCVAMDGNDVITSTEPTGGESAWTAASIELLNSRGNQESLEAASCPEAGLCVLTDGGSAVITSTEPTKGASAWMVSNLEVGSSALEGVSCVPGLCVAVDYAGNVVASTDPTGGAGAWSEAHVDGHALDGVSCPSAGLCVAVDSAGDVLTSTDPTGGAGAWSIVDVDGSRPFESVSCPSQSMCVATANEGYVVTSTDPTGGAGAWSVTKIAEGFLKEVSCPSAELCVAVVGPDDVATSTEPGVPKASAWTVTQVNIEAVINGISCASEELCVMVGLGDVVLTSTDPAGGGGTWSAGYIEGLNGLEDVSCEAADLCVATAFAGNGSAGNVIESTNPLDGVDSWVKGNMYGLPVRPPDAPFELYIETLPGMSCAPGLCVVIDTQGNVIAGTQSATVPVNSLSPVASGTPAPGQTLSCSNGSWTSYPPPTFTYQWLRDGTPIGGASTSTYEVQAADQSHGLTCQVTASNSAGSESATSNTLQVPAAQAPGDGGGGSGGSGDSSGGGGNPGTLTGTVSNAFVLNGMESVAARGTVKVKLTLPGPGTLQILGTVSAAQFAGASRPKKKRKTTLVIARLRLTISKAGRIVVTLVPTAGAKAILATRGKLRATVTITYTPKGGAPRSIVRAVTFRLKRRR